MAEREEEMTGPTQRRSVTREVGARGGWGRLRREEEMWRRGGGVEAVEGEGAVGGVEGEWEEGGRVWGWE